MHKVTDPREVIGFLRKDKNRNLFGAGREITHCFFNEKKHGCCVQLRQFFHSLGNGFTLHYEIEEYRGGIGVEIHSELVETLPCVHTFIYNQFKDGHGLKLKGKARKGELKVNKAYRFAIHRIKWQEARDRDKVIEDIKVAVDELYRKYDAYLNYVEGYYFDKGTVRGCKSYVEFMREVTA